MPMPARRILIIGYGEMGRAMEYLLSPRHLLSFWNRSPMAVHACVDLERAATEVDFIIYCVPVTPLAGLAKRLQPVIPGHTLSLSVGKGLDDAGRPAAGIFEDVYAGRCDYAVLYGPMISEEINAGRPAFAQAGTSRPGLYPGIAGLFRETGLALEYSSDMTGISWSSVLKNVYAILFGAADELGLGDNVRGCLSVACLREMAAIVTRLGGQETTAHQLAGLGDLITTATSEGSHHHTLGRRLVRGERGDLHGEGVHTLAMVDKYGLIDVGAFPLLALASHLVDDPARFETSIMAVLRGA